ncbi:MAG: site-specific integrase [Lachnospiraceae bacterium]|nr:site-specific integrase [Lachnospiraceae bacterium]
MKTRGKVIEKPPVSNIFAYGAIQSWTFRNSITSERGKYCIRFRLRFENGEEKAVQKGGFKTIRAAQKAKEEIIAQLIDHSYSPFDVSVKELYDYWLYYYMIDEIQITYSTFVTYRNIIYNYLLKCWGEKKKLSELGRDNISDALSSFPSKSLFIHGCTVLRSSFSFATAKNLISSDPTPDVIEKMKRKKKQEKFRERSYSLDEDSLPDAYRVLSAEEVSLLLYTAKEQIPPIYMPLLFTITTGARISEALGIKFSDIDFGKKILNLRHQVGRTMDSVGLETGELYSQRVVTKTQNGVRSIPLADFVIDDIIMTKRKYDTLKSITYNFKDYGYICFQSNGKPYNRSNMYKPYRRLLEMCNIEYITWHGLRHTYASLLAEDGISMKAISECMGHFNPEFTKKVYDGSEQAQIFWEKVKPEEKEILDLTEYADGLDLL